MLTANLQFKASRAALQLFRAVQRWRFSLLLRWRFIGLRPHEVLIEPVDLHIAAPAIAHQFYYGHFALAGHLVHAGSRSPFSIKQPNIQWHEALHNFSWLRHMDAEKSHLAAAHARSLLEDWIDRTNQCSNDVIWRGDIVAQRIMAWLSHSYMLLNGASQNFSRKFIKSLNFQVRYLRAAIKGMDDNEGCLQAHIALSLAAVSLSVTDKQKRLALNHLERCLHRQILPDGGHISRNPAVLLQLLSGLLSLRYVFYQRGETPPRALVDAVERMLPALRFFQHQDGTLARFNGVNAPLSEQLAFILDLDETAGTPFSYAPHSGYQRINYDQTTIIADIGCAPPHEASCNANAGCLSFEMSSGKHSFIVNSGVDCLGGQERVFLGRTTAAHSTAIINDTSSCRFAKQKQHANTPIMRGPNQVKVSRIEGAERQGFIASHNGYQRAFNLFHERGIVLNANGKIIDGFDRFSKPNATFENNARCAVAVRFHLHPNVEVSYDINGGLRLEVLGGDAWNFSSPDAEIQLDDSIFFASQNGPKRTRQIILNFHPSTMQKVRWRFVRIAKA